MQSEPLRSKLLVSKALIILVFLLLVVGRIPAIFTVGRFWAEEGVVYYYDAWHESWLDALFTVHTGYLNLAASVATLLAFHLATLEHAPLVTAIFACAIQMLPAVLLATSRIPWLQSRLAFALALVLVLIPAGDAEVWLNSITSQFHMALCVGLILATDVMDGGIGIFRAAVLLAAPLTGPLSGTLAPLFCLRAVLDRSRSRLVQTILLSAPTLVQAAMVLTHPEPTRSIGIGVPLLVAVIGIQNVILPMTGPDWTLGLGDAAFHAFQQGVLPKSVISAALLGIGALGAAVYRWGDRPARWLFVAGCILAIAAYSTAITLGQPLYLLMWLGGRYAYASTVLLSLSLLGVAANGARIRRVIPIGLLVWMIGVGAEWYFCIPDSHTHGANWQSEVAAWRHDPTYKLRVWPRGWTPELTLEPSAPASR